MKQIGTVPLSMRSVAFGQTALSATATFCSTRSEVAASWRRNCSSRWVSRPAKRVASWVAAPRSTMLEGFTAPVAGFQSRSPSNMAMSVSRLAVFRLTGWRPSTSITPST